MDFAMYVLIALSAVAVALAVNQVLRHEFIDEQAEHAEQLAREQQKKDRNRRAAEKAGDLGRATGFARSDADRYRRRLARAGLRLDPATWRGVEILATIVVAFLGLLLGLSLGNLGALLVALLVGAGIGLVAPRLFVALRARERCRQVERDLPDVLDLLAINVEAGATLERGFKQIAAKCSGPLAEEFGQVDRDINLFNISNVAALERMAERSESRQLGIFCSSLSQSLIQGASIGPALKAQADAARSAQFDALEEQANKLAVKAVIPMALFYLPSTLIIGAAPFLAQVVEMATMYAGMM